MAAEMTKAEYDALMAKEAELAEKAAAEQLSAGPLLLQFRRAKVTITKPGASCVLPSGHDLQD